MNDTGYPFFQKMSFGNANSFLSEMTVGINWKTSGSQSISHAKFLFSR